MEYEVDLDKLVAEKVMDWELWNGQWSHKDTKEMTHFDVDLFSPTTEIQDAWLVVENNSFNVDVIKTANEYVCKMWTTTNYRGEGIYETARASTAPMAICLAALKQKGFKVP